MVIRLAIDLLTFSGSGSTLGFAGSLAETRGAVADFVALGVGIGAAAAIVVFAVLKLV